MPLQRRKRTEGHPPSNVKSTSEYAEAVFPRTPRHRYTWIFAASFICANFLQRYICRHIFRERKGEIFSQNQKTPPTIEIFAAPPPLTHASAAKVGSAISSWSALPTQPKVTLIGEANGLRNISRTLGVNHDPMVDHSFLGRPLFNSLIARANASSADITVFINADIVLLPDFISALHRLAHKSQHFFAMGSRYDVDVLPDESHLSGCSARDYVLRSGALHNFGGMDFWAWTTKGPPLVLEPIPPFVFARGKYDNWFAHEVITTNNRIVVDLTESVVSVHIRHSYEKSQPPQAIASALVPRVSHDSRNEKDHAVQNFWSGGKLTNFELFINIHLSIRHGSYMHGFGTTQHAPWKLFMCHEKHGTCFQKRKRPALCFCEYSAAVPRVQVDPRIDRYGRAKTRNINATYEKAQEYEIPTVVTRDSARNPHFGLPLTLLDAIASVMRNGTVVLTSANYGYRNIMMNWVCHLRRLGVTNFIVAALDEDLYKYAIKRGVATYYEDSFDKGLPQRVLREEALYGTSEFQKITKMKTHIVSNVLRLGYDVLWSDCDVIFLQDPLEYLQSIPGDILVQSDAPDDEDSNAMYRMSPGLYLARSSSTVIHMLDNVINRGTGSNLTEQPSFYEVFCGTRAQFRNGATKCIHGKLVSFFLDRSLFLNGMTRNIWNTSRDMFRVVTKRSFTVHNNWIDGSDARLARLQRQGLMVYINSESRCNYL